MGRMEEVRLLSGDRSRRNQECNLFVIHIKEYSLIPDLFNFPYTIFRQDFLGEKQIS